MYYRKPPRKKARHYLMPFIIIALLIAIIIAGWQALNNAFIGNSQSISQERVFLNIENGSAKAMTVGKGEWVNAPDKIYLYRGERIKTGADGRVSLTFFDQSIVRLDKRSEVEFTQLKRKKDDSEIKLLMKDGDVWTNVERINNPDSSFSITTDTLSIDTRGGVFAVQYPGTVYMIDGFAQVDVKSDDEVIKSYTLGIGQQLVIDEEAISAIEKDEDPQVIFALDEEFKSSAWYLFNMKKDGAIEAFEESDEEEEEETGEAEEGENTEESADEDDEETVDASRIGEPAYVTDPSGDIETNAASISVEGFYDKEEVAAVYVGGRKASLVSSSKWKVSTVPLDKEGVNTLAIEMEDNAGNRTEIDSIKVTLDTEAPEVPVIGDPVVAEGETSVTLEDIVQEITGTVSSDTDAVIVNDYRLGKYVPGSKEFKYFAKTVYGNLEVGENEFEVIAEDKAGNQSEPATITLVLEQEVFDEKSEEVEESTSTEAPASSSSGGVKITSPNNGENFETSETSFVITGEVPTQTKKVIVDGYTLQGYTAGDSTFTYRASSGLGNLEIGEKNTYTAKAYDENDELIGEAVITIDVESDQAGAPTITIPTSSGAYTTTLAEIVVGGTVGKWIQKVYVNGELVKSYVPGSQKWTHGVTLNPGENTISVQGEKDGNKTSSVSTKITLE